MRRVQFRSDRTEEMYVQVKHILDHKGVALILLTVYTQGSASTFHLSRHDAVSLRDALTQIIASLPPD